MALRLYADECVDARIVTGIRRRGVEVVTAADEGLLGADDVTHAERASSGRGHPGLIFILPRTSIGDAVRRITLIAHGRSAEDLRDWIEWVP